MEIEAKFRVPDEAAFKRLDETVQLGSFQVSPGRLIDLHDRYLDTGDYRVLAAGYFCRRRESRDGVVMTLKALKGGEGALHRREEVSVELAGDAPPAAWPDGPARDLALRLAGDRTVAELALDRVTVTTRRGDDGYLECEIELRPGGTEADLRELMAIVHERWRLEPVSESKFARGLALATGVPLDRSQDWQRELRRLRVQQWVTRTREEAHVGAEPAAVVGGLSESEAAAEVPTSAAKAEPTISVLPTLERRGETEAEAGPPEGESGMRELFARARSGAAQAAEGGADVMATDAVSEQSPAEAAEEGVQEQEQEEAEEQERAEEEQEAEEEEAGAEPEEQEQAEEEEKAEEVEAEAEEQEPAEEVERAETEAEAEVAETEAPEEAEAEAIETEAPEEAEEGKGAEGAEPESPEAEAAEAEAAERRKKERARPGIVSDDTMAEAARKTLLFHFERMVRHEPGTREGEDPEELHDMRVATRRMRAALRVFDGYIDPDVMKPYAKALRRTGRTLGTVRDLDVFYEKTRRYLDSLPAGHEDALDPLIAAWRERRDEARAVMIEYLDSRAHGRFTRRFGEFLEKPGAGATEPFNADGEPVPRLVRDALPVVLYERLAHVRAFDEWLDDRDVPLARYHRLRIASKGLRYTLEFFEEVLGPGARPLIDHVKALQDHLGDLQDAVVGCGVAGTFLTWGTWQVPERPDRAAVHPVLNAPGVATYLAHRQEEIATLVETFPPVWEKVGGSQFARDVAELIAAL